MFEKQDIKTRLATAFAEGRAAHVSIDFQNYYCQRTKPYPGQPQRNLKPLQQAAHLTQTFREATQNSMPQILVAHSISSAIQSIFISPDQAINSFYGIKPTHRDILIPKAGWSSFDDTTLDKELWQQGADTFILSGVRSSRCILATVLDGIPRGYKIYVVPELTADYDEPTHRFALLDMEKEGATIIPLIDVMVVIDALKTPAAQTQPDPAPNQALAFG
jgi:nicotinamidase-related amidase